MAFHFRNQQVIYRTQPVSVRQATAISSSSMASVEALGYQQPSMVVVNVLDAALSSTDVNSIIGHRLAIHSRPEPQAPLRFPREAAPTQSSTRVNMVYKQMLQNPQERPWRIRAQRAPMQMQTVPVLATSRTTPSGNPLAMEAQGYLRQTLI